MRVPDSYSELADRLEHIVANREVFSKEEQNFWMPSRHKSFAKLREPIQT